MRHSSRCPPCPQARSDQLRQEIQVSPKLGGWFGRKVVIHFPQRQRMIIPFYIVNGEQAIGGENFANCMDIFNFHELFFISPNALHINIINPPVSSHSWSRGQHIGPKQIGSAFCFDPRGIYRRSRRS